MKLLLTRHGQSRWQTEGDSAGPDAALSSLGEVQARRLGRYLLRHEDLGHIVTSHLQRARRTADIVASYVDITVEIDEDLREFDSWDAGQAPMPVSIWNPTPATAIHPENQTFRARVISALKRIAGDGTSDETVLIVAHGGVVGSALRELLGAPTQRLWTSNTALHCLEWTGEFWLVRYVNRQEHLPRPLRSA
jgi:broad specificity phosphatase PhoE